MDLLVTLAPVGLILLVCGGMHFVMMRGMHGGAADGNAHDMRANHASGTADADKLRLLESEVASLREQVDSARKVPASSATGASSNGRRAGPRAE